jgi:mono/diheme cytochrome c family protein
MLENRRSMIVVAGVVGCLGAVYTLCHKPSVDPPVLLDGHVDEVDSSFDASGMPLLGSSRGGHAWFSFCEGKSDDTALPPDPRSLVVPGVNVGKAVHFNTFWASCNPPGATKTCGELRARMLRGKNLTVGEGAIGAGNALNADATSSSVLTIPAARYNEIWKHWGLSSRPANFDELVAERYGVALSEGPNPYPLPGEDPNHAPTPGGSGRLPMAFTQLRNPDGSYTGNLGITCAICHSGRIGTRADGATLGAQYGTNGLSDLSFLYRDLGGLYGIFSVLQLNKLRGTGNITNFQGFTMLSIGDPKTKYPPFFWTAPSTGTEDPPNWWNLGHRPRKFFAATVPVDSTRAELAFYWPLDKSFDLPAAEGWILAHHDDSNAWVLSLKSPIYPGPIDQALAEQGSVLFHTKDLWDPNLKNPVAPPDGGNGSCASCHGAYAPRFVNDPAFLETPLLEGIAAHVIAKSLINTDTARVDGETDAVAEASTSNWFSYRDQPECAIQTEAKLGHPKGYLAPPLYGVWASGPYFHNGSVPNVWEVLKSSERKPLWRRVSRPPPASGPAGAPRLITGFDTDLQRAYDFEHLGWKYEPLECGQAAGALPFVDCDPRDPLARTIPEEVLAVVYKDAGLAFNLLNVPILTDAQIEARKVYSTHKYSQSNTGHEFTDVLTDAERRAILEYLKTL